MNIDPTAEAVLKVKRCRLAVEPGSWDFAERRAREIDSHWQRRVEELPGVFNGTVHLMRRHAISDGVLDGAFVRADFKSYLYWRDRGRPDCGTVDAFGSALIRSADGAVMLGVQRRGINAGLAYPPGGFIDERDVKSDGAIDIEASIVRELAEETGLTLGDVERTEGFYATFTGRLLSIGIEFRSRLATADLTSLIARHIAGEEEPELARIVAVRSSADAAPIAMPRYAGLLVEELLANR